MSFPFAKDQQLSDLKPQETTYLSEEAFDKLTEILENPPAPTQAMKDLLALSGDLEEGEPI